MEDPLLFKCHLISLNINGTKFEFYRNLKNPPTLTVSEFLTVSKK